MGVVNLVTKIFEKSLKVSFFDFSINRLKIRPVPKNDRSEVVDLDEANIFVHTFET